MSEITASPSSRPTRDAEKRTVVSFEEMGDSAFRS